MVDTVTTELSSVDVHMLDAAIDDLGDIIKDLEQLVKKLLILLQCSL